MTETAVIRVRDLRQYLNGYPDDAVVLRDISDAHLEGAYVDLNVAMNHLEQENGVQESEGEDDDDLENGIVDEDEDEDDDEAELERMRALTAEQEGNISAWEKAQG